MLILLCLLTLVTSKQKNQLTDAILHHELLDYSLSSVRDSHHRHRRDITSPIQLTFTAFDTLFSIQLQKNREVFTEDVVLSSTQGDIDYDFTALVKGRVNGDISSLAHGHIEDGLFQGVVHYGNESYHIEPSAKYLTEPLAHSLIYRERDVLIQPAASTCGVKNSEGRDSPFYNIFGKQQHPHSDHSEQKRTKRATNSNKPYTYCTLYMGADNKFYKQHSSGYTPSIVSKLGTYVEEVNKIFGSTDFPGYEYNIKFLIKRIHVYDTADNEFDRKDYAVARFLDLFSTSGNGLVPHDYCIAYMFTHRDFEDGVLGLAWVASSGRDSGGLCTRCREYDTGKSRCLNTGIVTTKNVNEVPPMQSYLTFGHELGHNFGSPHDPASCSPGNLNGGNYLMYPHANTGNDRNNKQLSSCSREIMGPIISIRGSACFVNEPNVCGNMIKDGGEQCDCGDSTTCSMNTTVQGVSVEECCDQKCSFKKPHYKCSKMDGLCCDLTKCEPYDTDSTASAITCSNATDCRQAATCTLGTTECAKGEDKPNGSTCSSGTKVCEGGECSRSLCYHASTVSCQCTAKEEDKCQLCCRSGAMCYPAVNTTAFPQLVPYHTNKGMNLTAGTVCNNDIGYCDIFLKCRIVDEDGPIASLGNYIFNGVLYEAASNVAKDYWYYCIMLSIGIICFMVAFIAVCSKTVKPPPINREGDRMSYPVTYHNKNHKPHTHMEMTGHR